MEVFDVSKVWIYRSNWCIESLDISKYLMYRFIWCIEFFDISKYLMYRKIRYIELFDVSKVLIYRNNWCMEKIDISKYLMYRRNRYIDIFNVSKYCTRWTDHYLDHLDPNLLLWYALQDLYSTDQTQDACPRSSRLYGSHPSTWARSYRSYRSGINLPCLADLDRQLYCTTVVGIDCLSDALNILFIEVSNCATYVNTWYLVHFIFLPEVYLPFASVIVCLVYTWYVLISFLQWRSSSLQLLYVVWAYEASLLRSAGDSLSDPGLRPPRWFDAVYRGTSEQSCLLYTSPSPRD